MNKSSIRSRPSPYWKPLNCPKCSKKNGAFPLLLPQLLPLLLLALAHLPLTFADEGGRIESYRGAPAPITVNVDTDALAAAIAAVLDARDVATRSVESSATTRRVPVPVRKSFWSGALHADVLMALVAMVIVLVVLVAWSS